MKQTSVALLLSILLTVLDVAQETQQKSTAQAPSVPDTPAGRHLSAFLQALNTGDINIIRDFVASRSAKSAFAQATIDEYAQFYAAIYNDTRGLNLYSIERSDANDIVAVAQSRLAGEWHNIWLQVSEAPPYGVTSIGFLSVTRPAAANPRVKMGDSEIAEQLQTFLDKLVKADLFSGVVLVAKDGKPIYKKAYGLASMGFNVANRVDTKFNIGSMNKMFTAVAIMQLVEQGKLSLNEPIVKYLPDYPNNAVASKVTIHHLLTHTSGLGDYFGEKFEMVKAKLKRIQDYFPLFVDAPLLFELGQKFGYSNAGYVVLGAVIEKASGRDYFDYVREHVYKPARMVNSDSYEIDRDILDLAVGYTRNDLSGRPVLGGVRRNNLFVLPVKGSPAGGGYSTVDDLLSFDRALRQHKLLSSKSSDIIITGRVAMSADTKYAYGFTEHTANGKRIVGHNGFFSGYNSRLDMYLDDSYTVVVLSNYDFPIAERVANKVREMITQE